MSGLAQDGTAKPVSQDQILRREREQRKFISPIQFTARRIGSHIPVDAQSVEHDDHTFDINTYVRKKKKVGNSSASIYWYK